MNWRYSRIYSHYMGPCKALLWLNKWPKWKVLELVSHSKANLNLRGGTKPTIMDTERASVLKTVSHAPKNSLWRRKRKGCKFISRNSCGHLERVLSLASWVVPSIGYQNNKSGQVMYYPLLWIISTVGKHVIAVNVEMSTQEQRKKGKVNSKWKI